MVREAGAAIGVFVQFVALDHGAHAPVHEQDVFLQEGAEGLFNTSHLGLSFG